jgi:multicomponent Na+:H+ antiporter subunit B
MSRTARLRLFLPALLGLGLFFLWGLFALPPLGDYRGPYGDIVNAIAVPERQTTDMVAAVNFDIRGIDTLGEEFILFASVMGVLLILRKQDDESSSAPEEQAPGRSAPPASDAVRVLSVLLIGFAVLFGLYTVTHGHLTPGGGFQGGAIITSVILLLYLAGNFDYLKRFVSHHLVDATEALGAGGFVLVGLLGMLAGKTFLENVLPLGQAGQVLSSGTILTISITTGLEVASGFFLVFHTFLEDALEHHMKGPK